MDIFRLRETRREWNYVFPKIKIAKHAFLWHVLVNVSSHSWRKKWIGSLMLRDGIHNFTILKERRRRNNLRYRTFLLQFQVACNLLFPLYHHNRNKHQGLARLD
eukprot:scaffold130241_cov65-Attheya_sp.AAC.5